MDGRVYCAECLRCPHGTLSSYVCPTCVRRLHSYATFQGWRFADLEDYVRSAWREYGLEYTELQTWAFRDTEDVMEYGEMWQAKEARHGEGWRVTVAPPHHRFTASDHRSAPPRTPSGTGTTR